MKDSPIGRCWFFTCSCSFLNLQHGPEKRPAVLEVGIFLKHQKSMTAPLLSPLDFFLWWECHPLYTSNHAAIHQYPSIHEVPDSWFTSFSLHRDFRFSSIDFETRFLWFCENGGFWGVFKQFGFGMGCYYSHVVFREDFFFGNRYGNMLKGVWI